ncbi:MAG: ATP phosphoribosyltransferase regulatory subunit [Gammaproteobacteria bacterium]|nr:MAG: ATP phosphoribosyltransferase regulatory subunit [Gammaproteobacteria bacterium]
MSTAERWLLPEGIEELLPQQAAKLESLRRDLLDLYASWGYDQVFPPLVEYLESLLTGVGNDLSLQTFILTDQLTGRTMGIRADMTPQVARIDAHTLNQQGPTRLCYTGEVLHTRSASLMDSRSLVQIGVELFGHQGIEADIEVISLMLQTLAKANIDTLHLDLGHVVIYRKLANAAGLSESQEQALYDIYQRKAVPELQTFVADNVSDGQLRASFLALTTLAGDLSVLAQAKEVLASVPDAAAAIADLETIADYVAANFPGVTLYFDLGELRGYHYHTGAVFSAYVPGKGQAIASGGRYDKVGKVFGRARPATGFSADLAQLIKFMPVPEKTALVFAPAATDLADTAATARASLHQAIAALRASGIKVIQALPGQTQGAAEMGCTGQLVFKDNQWQTESI